VAHISLREPVAAQRVQAFMIFKAGEKPRLRHSRVNPYQRSLTVPTPGWPVSGICSSAT
jgi:hypothetical protein